MVVVRAGEVADLAGRGPHPAPNPRRRNKHPSEELSGRGVDDFPPLPDGHLYSAETHRWWATWASSPQAEAFLATDIQRLMMLAPLVEAYFECPDKTLMAEIRLNEERLGATVRDRQSLRMHIREEKEQEEASPDRDRANVVRLRKAFEDR